MSEHLTLQPRQEIRKADLNWRGKRYVENLQTQMHEAFRKYGIETPNLKEGFERFAVLVVQQKISSEDFARVHELTKELRRISRDELGEKEGVYPVFVKYEQPSREELEKRFDRIVGEVEVDDALPTKQTFAAGSENKFLPLESLKDLPLKDGLIRFELLEIGNEGEGEVPTSSVLDRIRREGYRPALYEELLSFAEQYPDEQKKYVIPALGSVLSLREEKKHKKFCAFLSVDRSKGRELRELHLNRMDMPSQDYWYSDNRYLVVRV